MRFLKAFFNFWYDFLIGDDWKIAAYTAVVLLVVGWLVATEFMADGLIALTSVILLGAFFCLGVLYDARKISRKHGSAGATGSEG